MAQHQWPLTTLGSVSAVRNPDGTWTQGLNVINLSVPPDAFIGSMVGGAIKRLYLQRATINNVDPPPGFPSMFSTASLLPTENPAWLPGSNFTTVASWTQPQLDNLANWPTQFQEPGLHSTFYYYRLSYIVRKFANSQSGIQFDSNVATIVQTFELNVCTTPKDCQPRLTWDAPVLS